MRLPLHWRLLKWGDLATLKYGKALRSYRGVEGLYPVFGTNGQIGWHEEYLCPHPGVVVGRKGAYRGIHFSSKPFFVIDTAFYLSPLDRIAFDIKWAYYQLLDFDINKLDSGSAIPSTSREAFYEIPVLLPPVEVQRKIAGTLSAYDDLIENNLRRIQILEEMAQALYREWFVEFRFPGHDNVEWAETEGGKLPEGWTRQPLGDVSVNFDRLRKPLSKMERAKRKGPYPYYGAAKVFDYIDDYIFDGDYLLFAEDGSVMTKDRHPVLQWASGRFWANNHTHILQGGDSVSTELLYLTLSMVDVVGYVTGAAQPKITQANLNRIPVVVASSQIAARFDALVKPMIALVQSLKREGDTLAATRDLVLPKLVSGELDTSELDIDVGEAA